MRLSGICVYKHEATASLDVENETLIQTALSRLIADKTVLVIAHRMRTVAGADKIVVLSDGTVAEEGAPKDLAEKEWCVCPYGKTADRKPELETCVKEPLIKYLIGIKRAI